MVTRKLCNSEMSIGIFSFLKGKKEYDFHSFLVTVVVAENRKKCDLKWWAKLR